MIMIWENFLEIEINERKKGFLKIKWAEKWAKIWKKYRKKLKENRRKILSQKIIFFLIKNKTF